MQEQELNLNNINLNDITITVDTWIEDCSFDHEFGIEKVLDFKWDNIRIFKEGKDITNMTLKDFIDATLDIDDELEVI